MDIKLSKLVSPRTTYAFAEVDKQVAALKAQGVQVIDFGVGDPKDPTPDFVIHALNEASRIYAASGYPSYIGAPFFRSAAADYLRRMYGVEIDPETEVSSTIGSKESVFHFPRAFIDPGDVVICPTPGYPPYKVGTIYAGGIPYFVPLTEKTDFLIDLEAIPADICAKAKIIWTNYPNSPTGKLAPRDWLEKLAEWAHQHNIIIAADEGCYHDIYFGAEKPLSMLEVTKEGVVVFYSLSKGFNMTGYRVGFVAGDARIIDAFRKVKTQMDSGTPTFIQHAAMVALQDTAFVAQNREMYRQKRALMLEALQSAGLPACENEGTFYIWQKAPQGMTGEELAQRLLKLGIVVTPGQWISDPTAEGFNPGEHYVRIALVPTLTEIEEACQRLKKSTL